jgi:FAD/FMN-containing dehydrogenase
MPQHEHVLNALRDIAGAPYVLTSAPDCAPFLTDWRGNYTGNALAIALPANTEEVAAIVALANQTRTPIVPQGGNTGLVGGGIPDASGEAIVVSLKRMQRIRAVDRENSVMIVDAGVILQNVQQAADEHDLFFPLSLAAEGSCTIGGNLSCSASKRSYPMAKSGMA